MLVPLSHRDFPGQDAAMALVHVDGEPCTTVSLPHSPESVQRARRQMVDELLAFGLARDVISDGEIVLGELAANAVEHGRPIDGSEFEVSWCVVGGRLRISVIDGGSVAVLKPAVLGLDSLRGRGLHMVDTVCDHWTADLIQGTRVTAELAI